MLRDLENLRRRRNTSNELGRETSYFLPLGGGTTLYAKDCEILYGPINHIRRKRSRCTAERRATHEGIAYSAAAVTTMTTNCGVRLRWRFRFLVFHSFFIPPPTITDHKGFIVIFVRGGNYNTQTTKQMIKLFEKK